MLEGYTLSYGYLFFVIFFIGFLQKLLKFDIEFSRKLIHLFIGFVWLILYKYFTGTIHFVIIPLSFVFINYLSYKFKIFKMFERESGNKNHLGTVYYAASITVLAAVSLLWDAVLLPFGIAVFCLSFGDAAAALFGGGIKRYNVRLTKEKSLVGTLSAIVFSVVGILVFMCFVSVPLRWYEILVVGIASGLLELVGKGLDNFALPFGVAILSTFFLHGV